jgi:hypothetical protein
MGRRWKAMLDRLRAGAGWTAWLAHSPMFGFWLVTALVAVGAGVELFRSPKHALELLAPLGTLIGVTGGLAKAKGVAAWPTRRSYEALEPGDETAEDEDGQLLIANAPAASVGTGQETK